MTSDIFESDCRLLIDTINSNSTPRVWRFISRCKDLLLSRNNFIVSNVRRQANKVAHNIAKASLCHSNPHIFMTYYLVYTCYSLMK